ncbi:hypothetical protein [Corynebacterium flavescens]|uniref:Uncharacterized protein n=1 Tax=Corynebacterium flavescens TaxID=28028 RepID=A0A1L7CNK7_CORFL|nr:hypothetical protein [Corynebacterium flavescens]APT87395.1 hypothetical protein CFLV_09540 [Corynebacterium flavescens]KAA8720483.1 hypothetical protein F4V60_09295 [Corynebacterium flavescens]GEB97756.1 hypothetical protein CFL01nite_12510 [Corynebacterium flavescens]
MPNKFRKPVTESTNLADLEKLLGMHRELNRLKGQDCMRLESCSIGVPPRWRPVLNRMAEKQGVSMNGMLLEAIMGYVLDGSRGFLTQSVPAYDGRLERFLIRLPKPFIEHCRWVARSHGISLSQMLACIVGEFMQDTIAEAQEVSA